jgi:hypothetical protein
MCPGHRKFPQIVLGDCHFRPAPTPSRSAAGHLSSTVVAKICDFGTTTRVGKGDAQGCALVLANFLAAAITNENGSPSQRNASFDGLVLRSLARNRRSATSKEIFIYAKCASWNVLIARTTVGTLVRVLNSR